MSASRSTVRSPTPGRGDGLRAGTGHVRHPARDAVAAALARPLAAVVLVAATLAVAACGGTAPGTGPVVVRVSGSAVGDEAELLRRQLARFNRLNPDIHAEVRVTPDDADQRHQLFVQWLNAHAGTPDVLQLDVVWTAEFAAAGWILPLDRFDPPVDSFFPAAMRAARWRGHVYAVPWFVDVGMLYWRTDLMSAAPTTFDQLVSDARTAQAHGARYGIVWQGARYEGLVTVFLEYLTGFGGRIMDDSGRIAVDSPAAIRALRFMRNEITRWHITPREALTWHEEQTRFAFQNGDAAMMRNWPYAYRLMEDSAKSRVAGRFAVAPMPAAPGGRPAGALGGSTLAINAFTPHPRAAWRVVRYLTAPAQMLERARVVGEFPARPALFATAQLAAALPVPPADALRILRHAVPRPVSPVYTQLSEILQVGLHRALTGQRTPATALHNAARRMRALLRRVGLQAGSP